MSRASWIALVAATLVGVLITLLIRRKTRTLVRQAEAEAEAGGAESNQGLRRRRRGTKPCADDPPRPARLAFVAVRSPWAITAGDR
jgi:hypothetical protein